MTEPGSAENTEDIEKPSPVDAVRELGYPSLQRLLEWFPSDERLAEIKQLPRDEQASFIAEALGHMTEWEEGIDGIERYRPQDGGTTVSDLGIPREDINRVYSATQAARFYIHDFINKFIDKDLGRDYDLVSSKIKNAGQLRGFQQKLFQNEENRDRGVGIIITFDNGAPGIEDDTEGIFYISKIRRDIPVHSVSYHPEAGIISVSLPHLADKAA